MEIRPLINRRQTTSKWSSSSKQTLFRCWNGQISLSGYQVNESIQITFQIASVNGVEDIPLPLSNLFPVTNDFLGFNYGMISYISSGSSINILGIAFLEGQLVFFDRNNDQIGFAPGNSEQCTKVGTAQNIDVFAGSYNGVSAITVSTFTVVCVAMANILLLLRNA